jgi:hypothetical protein
VRCPRFASLMQRQPELIYCILKEICESLWMLLKGRTFSYPRYKNAVNAQILPLQLHRISWKPLTEVSVMNTWFADRQEMHSPQRVPAFLEMWQKFWHQVSQPLVL